MRASTTLRLCAVAVWVLAATDAFAMYTPNPAGRWQANHFFVGADLQYNSDKELDPAGEIDDEVGFFIRPSYALAPNATVYGRIGVQEAEHTDSELGIGFGLQAAWELPAASDWAIGASFDYLYWDLPHTDYHEIQFAPAVSYRIPGLQGVTPYAGLIADFLVDDLEEDDPIGLLLGSNFDIGTSLRFDAQIRLIAESGFLLSGGVQF